MSKVPTVLACKQREVPTTTYDEKYDLLTQCTFHGRALRKVKSADNKVA